MEYFDKLKIVGDNVKNVLVKGMVDTVFTVQSSVRDVLPGNPLTREYEIIKEVGLAGPGNAWHIFSTVKKSTKEPGSMFLLEKRLWSKFNKHTKDELIELFRNGVQQLTRLKHPRLLAIQHQLEESRDSIAFITEPVSCSLADCLRHSGGSHNFSDIEIRYGIMQICNALKFLHDDGKILHGNICPESILISEQSGLWKLGCFEHFLQGTLHPGNTKPSFTRKEFNFNAAEYSNPNLNYMAMEYVDGSVSPSEFSDMFSVGSLIFTLYNNGNTLLSCNSTNLRDLRRSLKTIRTATRIKSDVPKIVKKAIELLLSPDHSSRPNANNFLKSTFFVDEMALKALDYIDCLFQVDNLQRSMFYKSLLPLIPSLPSKIKLLRLMSAFELEFINCDIMPYVMPNIFVIANECNESEFDKYMLPKLKIVFRQTLNIQTLAVIMENMPMLLKKTNAIDVKDYILPVLYCSLDTQSQQIQDMCLTIIPSLANLIDNSSMRSAILPRIKRMCIETSILSVRVNCLLCVGKLCEKFDKWMIIDDVIPILQGVPSKEPAVLMTILGVIKVAMSPKDRISIEALATKFIPLIIPLSIETGLNASQFDAYMKTIKEMINTIEAEQKKKISQMSMNSPLPPIILSEKTQNLFNNSSHQAIDNAIGNIASPTYGISSNLDDNQPPITRDYSSINSSWNSLISDDKLNSFKDNTPAKQKNNLSYSIQSSPCSPYESTRQRDALKYSYELKTETNKTLDTKISEIIDSLGKNSISNKNDTALIMQRKDPDKQPDINNKSAQDHLRDLFG